MAAPNFVASATAQHADASTLNVGMPASALAGQRALLVVALSPATVSAAPTGFTPVGDTAATPTDGSGRLYVYSAVVGSVAAVDPGATVTVNFTGDSKVAMAIVVYEASDVDDSTVAGGGGGLAAITTPTATASDSARVVHFHGCLTSDGGAQPTWTPDAATTERVDLTSDHPTIGKNGTFCIADEVIAAPGATTARTATPTLSVQRAAAVVVLSVPTVRPVANAGPDQSVTAGALVNLDGSATDGGGVGGPYTWQWTQTAGTAVVLSDATAENPTFSAPVSSDTLTFELVATDAGAVASLSDAVTITVAGPEDTAVPNGDVDVVGWTIVGGATAFEVLADGSDATYIESPDNPVDETFKVNLSTLNDAAPEDVVALSVRVQRANATTAEVSMEIMEGVTVRATLAPTVISNDLWNQFDYTFTPAEISGVTNWADVDAVGTVSAAV